MSSNVRAFLLAERHTRYRKISCWSSNFKPEYQNYSRRQTPSHRTTNTNLHIYTFFNSLVVRLQIVFGSSASRQSILCIQWFVWNVWIEAFYILDACIFTVYNFPNRKSLCSVLLILISFKRWRRENHLIIFNKSFCIDERTRAASAAVAVWIVQNAAAACAAMMGNW